MFDPLADKDRLLRTGFFLADFQSGEVSVSKLLGSLGYTSADLVGTAWLNAIHPSDRPTYDSLWSRVADGHEDEFFAEYRIRTRKGGYRWVQTFAVVLAREPGGKISRLFGLDRDIGLRKQSEALLHGRFLDLERRYLMSENLRIAGSVVASSLDVDSTIAVILEQANTLFPFTGARVWAYRENSLELLGQEEDSGEVVLYSPATSPLVLRVANEKTPHIVDNLAVRLGTGGHASWIGIPLLFQGEARGVMEFWHEESGFFRSDHVWPAMAFADNVAVGLFNARQFRATQEASETDALTGLATRRKLERLGPKIFDQAKADGENLSAFMVDLDHFKTINDQFGHGQGDAVLRHFAQTCQSVLRKGDLICRFGGDEFVALLPHTDASDAQQVATRLRELFKSREFPFGRHQVSLSLGIASLKDGGFTNLTDLMEAADAALYRVKSRGRDGIETF